MEREPQVSIAWRNLTRKVSHLNYWQWRKKTILQLQSGHCLAGSLTGLLGASGSGKTTLLDILSGSTAPDSGHIYLGSHLEASPVSYYIRQHVHESIVGELTVEQILRYAYAFKNGGRNAPSEKADEHIKKTMESVLLSPEMLSRLFKKCSGGEQRRIAVCQELMALRAPTFILCDEPSTGLDSASAFEVISCLWQLAKTQHITVICSIHSPNSETLSLFDKVIVLSKTGQAIYSGPPNEINDSLRDKVPLSDHPPIEVLLKVACNGTEAKHISQLAIETYQKEESFLDRQTLSLVDQPSGLPCPRKAFKVSDFFISLCRQTRITFIAQLQTFLFAPTLFFAYFAFISNAFSFEGTERTRCLIKSTDNSISNSNSNCTFNDPLQVNDAEQKNIYFITVVLLFTGFLILITTTSKCTKHLKIFQTEHRNYWYSVGVHYWSSSVVSFIELNINVLFISAFSYFFSGQHLDEEKVNWHRLALYAFFIWLLCIYYQAVGQLVGTFLVDYPLIALLLTLQMYTIFTLFNGLYVKFNRTENTFFEQLSNGIGMVYVSRGIFWVIFVFDRCQGEGEYSIVEVDQQIEPEKIGFYVQRVLVNVVIVKLLTLLIMYIKFNVWKRKIKNNEDKIHDIDKNDYSFESKDDLAIFLGNKPVIPKESCLLQGKIVIAWRDLSLFSTGNLITDFGESKSVSRQKILNDLNGQLCFGTLNAMMGTSGAGKTSLLRVLNGQCKTRLSSETKIYLSKLTPIRTCFITQEVSGHLMKGLTGQQLLLYASRLKNCDSSSDDHKKIAIKWLTELDILQTANTPVERCSGGEMKRLVLGLELTSLKMPNLILVDEPLSGLDTYSALVVIETLCKVATTHPLTIFTSVHQPTNEILHKFDQLYILARGGVLIFSGAPSAMQLHIDKVPALNSSFSSFSSTLPIEKLIRQSCAELPNEVTTKLSQISTKQISSELLGEAYLTLDGVQPNRPRITVYSVYQLSRRYLQYLAAYLWKEWLAYLTICLLYGASIRILFTTEVTKPSACFSLEDDLSSCVKSAEQVHDELLLEDNFYYVFYAVNIYMLLLIIYSSIRLHYEFNVLENEHRNGWYHVGAFFLSRSLFEVVLIMITNFFHVMIANIYEPVVHSSIYLPLWALLTLAQLGYVSLGQCFTLLGGKNFTNTSIILCGTCFVLIIIGNTYVPIGEMHYLWQALSQVSLIRFTFENTMLLQFGFGRCKGSKDQNAILYTLNVDDSDYYRNIGMLILNVIFYRAVVFYLLVHRLNTSSNRQKRAARIVLYQKEMMHTEKALKA